MIGANVIEIGQKEFLDGITSSPETEDGGFSPDTQGINITSDATHLGILYAPADMVDKSTNLEGNIIAAVSDPDSGIGVNKYILTATGRFISADSSSVLTVRRTSAGAKTYSFPNSDIAVYKNGLYATSSNDITLATGTNLGSSFDETWWVTTKGKSALSTGVRHPLLVFEDSLWIGDGNLLHKWDGTTATSGFLTLNTGVVIIALGIEPGTGKMMISTSEGANGSDTIPRQAKIMIYDGFSNKPSRAVPVDDMVTEIYPLGGTPIMFYGQNVGYWNGSGIAFLRRLRSVTLSGTSLVYKHRVTTVGKALIIADGLRMLVMEETLPGQRRWYYNFSVPAFPNNVDAVFNMGNNIVGVGYDTTGSTPTFGIVDRSARTTGSLNFYSKKYKFSRPVKIRDLRIEYLDSVAVAATSGSISFITQGFVSVAAPSLTNDGAASTFEIYRKIENKQKFTTLQINYSNSGSTSVIAGIRRIIVSLDPVE